MPARLAFGLIFLTFLAGCRRGPTREWRADDHDEELSGGGAQAPAQASSVNNEDALVNATWTAACAPCHGTFGRGDGPNGPMVNAPDLTDKALLAARTDQQLADVIKNGRNKMPKFGSLPPNVVAGLVKRIRAVGGQ